MARNSVSSIVLEASRVQLPQSFKVFGDNTYIIANNMISWDNIHNYTLQEISPTFGMRRDNNLNGLINDNVTFGFSCGEESISAFDFGLLYSIFNAMIMARVEFGSTFKVFSEKLSREGLNILWLGNDAVIYSIIDNIIIPLKNADVERVGVQNNKIVITNFCNKNRFVFEFSDNRFVLSTADNELVSYITIPDSVKKSYHIDDVLDIEDDLSTPWDENSALGELIGENDNKSKCQDVLERYKKSPIIDTVRARVDLIIEPKKHYADTSEFFGSICYTDKEDIVMSVNFRRGLFIYKPILSEDFDDLRVDDSADFQKFFNVTDGCEKIMRYASTVVARPLSSAQLDYYLCEKIRESFLSMKLPRIPIKSAFGRVIIPEPVLVDELISGNGESLFCIVPVGVIGNKIICINSEDKNVIVNSTGWDKSSAFYDITEVI